MIHHVTMCCRKEGQIDVRKLKRATAVAHWGVPVLVTTFVVVYWVLGMANYYSPQIEVMMEEEVEQDFQWTDAAVAGLGKSQILSGATARTQPTTASKQSSTSRSPPPNYQPTTTTTTTTSASPPGPPASPTFYPPPSRGKTKTTA